MRPAAKCLRARGRHQFNPVVCGRRHCTSCGHWRHVYEFGIRKGRPGHTCHTCNARRNSAAYRSMTAAQRERRREYERIYKNAYRRAEGIPERCRHRSVKKRERLFLDPGPVVVALRRYELGGGSFTELAVRTGVQERSIYRFRVGESRHISIDLADRLALGLGSTLAALYGDAPAITLGPGHVRELVAA